VHEREASGKIVVDAKFGSGWGGWCFDPLRPHGVGLWKNIKRGWDLFFSHTRFELGDGFKIRFGENMWCREMTLKEAFLVLYGSAHEKNAFVATHLDFSSGSLQWDVSFIQVAHDWEVDVLASLYTLLYSPLLTKGSLMFDPSIRSLFV
jgi:hypothetical protein